LWIGLWVTLAASVVVVVSGDPQAKILFEQQPMKMAAAEALCDTEQGAGLYRPNLIVTYWGFRAMTGFGIVAMGMSAIALFAIRKRNTVPDGRWVTPVVIATMVSHTGRPVCWDP
jgi:cytochrome bd-type quinol oxidase subunit 1